MYVKSIFCVIGICMVLVMGSILSNQVVYASILDEEFSAPDFSTPAGISSHVLNFFHHSTGGNLLNDALKSDLIGLGYQLHSCIDYQYIYENDFTDYRHWYKRFQRELGVWEGTGYHRYDGPDTLGDPIVGPLIPIDGFMLSWYEARAEEMDIIMFKSCFPGSEITSYNTQYDSTTANNGYGNVIGGTPYSDNGINNFVYLNSGVSVDSPYDTTYWTYGTWDGTASSLAQLKCAYRGMLNIFVENPDILFIAFQAPPMLVSELTNEQANNNRELARWFREDWLHQFDPTGTDKFEDYPLKNVVPFDFFNAIAWTGNDPVLDKEYFWFVNGGFPDNTLDTTDPTKLGKSSSSDLWDAHPQTWMNQRTSTIFCGGTDTFSQSHNPGYPQRTYSCWINAVVNRWEKNMEYVPSSNRNHVLLYLYIFTVCMVLYILRYNPF